MTDDFSELPTNASCYSISSATSIYTYRNNTRDTYTKLGAKWYKTASQTYTNLPSSSVCFSYSDITQINSNAEFYPLYYTIGFLLAVFAFRFIWRIIRPIFRAHL